MELTRDMLNVDQIIGEGQSQMLVERDIIVPDIKPDIARILSVEGKVNITSKNVEQDRIAVEGSVNFEILYAADGETQPIYSMNQDANFSHFIDIPGSMPRMDSDVNCGVEHITYNKLNGRKLNLKCVLNTVGRVIDNVPVETIKEVSGVQDIQYLRDTIVLDQTMGDSAAQTVVRSTIEIPENLPPADDLLKYKAGVHKKDVKLEEGKIVITGCVFVDVLYSSRNEQVDVFKLGEDMVFTHTMEIPEVMPDMACRMDYNIEDIYAELKENDAGELRNIDIEVVVGLKAKVVKKVEMPVIIDAYAPSININSEKGRVALDSYFGEGSSELIVKENLSIPEDNIEMEKVYDVIYRPTITECRVLDNRVEIEGVVGCDVIYLVRGEERLVQSFSEEVPFRTQVNIPGCNQKMKPEVNVDIEHMDSTMLTKNEVEIKVVLNCSVILFDKIEKDFISRMEEIEGEVLSNKSSITIYVVQPKDTLWMIAKRYYTTIDDIVKINDIEFPDRIAAGMKLIIPRRI